jgi:hypothetical protein
MLPARGTPAFDSQTLLDEAVMSLLRSYVTPFPVGYATAAI